MSNKRPVLLVESDSLDRRVLAQDLRRAGYEVTEASTPDLVQRVAGDFGLLITHIHFYNEKGNRDYAQAAALCKTLRDQVRPNLPIIGLSSLPNDDDLKVLLRRYEFPADLIIFDVDANSSSRLVKRVNEVLDESPAYVR